MHDNISFVDLGLEALPLDLFLRERMGGGEGGGGKSFKENLK